MKLRHTLRILQDQLTGVKYNFIDELFWQVGQSANGLGGSSTLARRVSYFFKSLTKPGI